jgi:hypothetical protein
MGRLKVQEGVMTNRAAEDEMYYGLDAWRLWLAEAPDNLRRASRSSDKVATTDTCNVRSFRELVKLVSFLSVMNKRDRLLFRGQAEDRPLLPTIQRGDWRVPHRDMRVPLAPHRQYYWDALDHVCDRVASILRGKLPRHRPFETFREHPERRIAPWAVIQHYELWPTPVIDYTESLRVAASFGLGVEAPRASGYLYVTAVRRVLADPMLLDENARGPVALRLSAVCPPSAERPHLQNGFLIGEPGFTAAHLTEPPSTGTLIAKIRIVDESVGEKHRSSFWDEDFPRHSFASLLPIADEVLAAFEEAFEHRIEGQRAVLVDR